MITSINRSLSISLCSVCLHRTALHVMAWLDQAWPGLEWHEPAGTDSLATMCRAIELLSGAYIPQGCFLY
jgi:hypothetical protein